MGFENLYTGFYPQALAAPQQAAQTGIYVYNNAFYHSREEFEKVVQKKIEQESKNKLLLLLEE